MRLGRRDYLSRRRVARGVLREDLVNRGRSRYRFSSRSEHIPKIQTDFLSLNLLSLAWRLGSSIKLIYSSFT